MLVKSYSLIKKSPLPLCVYVRMCECACVCVCVCLRLEEAEGVGEPRDTEQLNLSSDCSDSRLMQGLWASAVLLGPSGQSQA